MNQRLGERAIPRTARAQFEIERAHARKLLEGQHHWWLNALAERQLKGEELMAPLFFRIRVQSLTGLASTDVE
jgi:hypothetical protein